MPSTRAPRHGSLQYWPHKRAKGPRARVRTYGKSKDAKPLGFAGFKAGMTHVSVLDTRKNSPTKGHEVSYPVTVLECPPLKVFGIRTYRRDAYGKHAIATLLSGKVDKRLAREYGTKDHQLPETISCDLATLLVHTQPILASTGQKKPHVFEMGMGGKPEDVLAFAKAHKEIKVSDAIKTGAFVDVHGITQGQGFQGAVRKFGVGIRRHKSEKTKRGAVMAPEGYAKVTFEAPMPGKIGWHTRTEWNKKVFLVASATEKPITPEGGFLHYGEVRSDYILLKGSVPGVKNAFVQIVLATRKNPKKAEDAPAIEHMHLASQQ